jgi:hypothetical protein
MLSMAAARASIGASLSGDKLRGTVDSAIGRRS